MTESFPFIKVGAAMFFRPISQLQSTPQPEPSFLANELGQLKLAIERRDNKLVQKLWHASPALQSCYRGEINNIGNAFYTGTQISDHELLENFLLALNYHCLFIFRKISRDNPRLKAAINACEFYSAKQILVKMLAIKENSYRTSIQDFVNTFTNVPVMQAVMRDLVLNTPKEKLSSYKLWQYTLLEQRLQELSISAMPAAPLGRPISVVDQSLSAQPMHVQSLSAGRETDGEKDREKDRDEEDSAISEDMHLETLIEEMPLKEVIAQFRLAAANRDAWLIDAIWGASPSLRAKYLAAKKDNDLSESDVQVDFAGILESGCDSITKAIWYANPSLLSWYNGKEISISDSRKKFRRALSQGHKTGRAMLQSEWANNPRLAQWYAGHTLDFGKPFASNLQTISLADLVRDFKKILPYRVSNIIDTIWENNALLRAYFSGQEMEAPFGKIDRLSTEDVIDNLILAMKGQSRKIAKYIFEHNKAVEYVLTCQDPALLEKQAQFFRAAIRMQCGYIAEMLWQKNSAIKNFYCGSPDLSRVSAVMLIDNFKAFLSSKSSALIKSMWMETHGLQAALMQLNADEAKKMLIAVLHANVSIVTAGYLKLLSNSVVINAVLNEEKFQKQHNYKAIHRRQVLQARLEELKKEFKADFTAEQAEAAPLFNPAEEIADEKESSLMLDLPVFTISVNREDRGSLDALFAKEEVFDPDVFLSFLSEEAASCQDTAMPDVSNAEETPAVSDQFSGSQSINSPATLFYYSPPFVSSPVEEFELDTTIGEKVMKSG